MTPWGDPDLQGIWTSEAELSVPFERPRESGTRQVLTDASSRSGGRSPSGSSRATTPSSTSTPLIDTNAGAVGVGDVAAAALARAQQDLAPDVARHRSA